MQYLHDVLVERFSRSREFLAGLKRFMDTMPVIPGQNREQELAEAMNALESHERSFSELVYKIK